jgi:DNA-binding FadR family transcriptional regulator
MALAGLRRGKDLVATLTEALAGEIHEGRLAPGDRLPTEAALASSARVSRTVVREAIAALKAAGLVETRQGSGAFVKAATPLFPLPLNGVEPQTVREILWILELRLAVEVEAATLAASRRTREHLDRLDAALVAFEQARQAGESGIAADLDFHTTVAAATGNPYFVRFMTELGEWGIPRRRLITEPRAAEQVAGYMLLVHQEHLTIRDAIAKGDSLLASATMRNHLAGSRSRYAVLAERGAAAEG